MQTIQLLPHTIQLRLHLVITSTARRHGPQARNLDNKIIKTRREGTCSETSEPPQARKGAFAGARIQESADENLERISRAIECRIDITA